MKKLEGVLSKIEGILQVDDIRNYLCHSKIVFIYAVIGLFIDSRLLHVKLTIFVQPLLRVPKICSTSIDTVKLITIVLSTSKAKIEFAFRQNNHFEVHPLSQMYNVYSAHV